MADRSLIIQAVKNYTRVKSFYFFPASELKPKQINGAITRWAKGVKADEVVAFMDTTLFTSGKEGFLATEKCLYVHMMYDDTVDLDTFRSAAVQGSDIIVKFEGSPDKKIYCSIYAQDVANFLNTLAKLSQDAARRKLAARLTSAIGGTKLSSSSEKMSREQKQHEEAASADVTLCQGVVSFEKEETESVMPADLLSVTSVEELNEAMADDHRYTVTDDSDWEADTVSFAPVSDAPQAPHSFLEEEMVVPEAPRETVKFSFCPYCGGVNPRGVQLCASCSAFLPNELS